MVGRHGRCIAIICNSGSGKSTVARALSPRLNIPHIEVDAPNWLAGWRALSLEAPAAWEQAVREAIAEGAWTTDGNYSKGAVPQILPRASDAIWLDYSRGLIAARVPRRSFARAIDGLNLRPGTDNKERFRRWLQKDHPIFWTWDTYRRTNERRQELYYGAALDHARKHRFRTLRETRN